MAKTPEVLAVEQENAVVLQCVREPNHNLFDGSIVGLACSQCIARALTEQAQEIERRTLEEVSSFLDILWAKQNDISPKVFAALEVIRARAAAGVTPGEAG